MSNLYKVLLFIFFGFTLNLSAQTLPVDAASGKIYYAEEVLVKDGPQSDLYNRAKAWFAAGKNKKALQVDDAANGLLIGNTYSLLSVDNGDKKQKLKLYYTIKLELEDDRYWYSISDLKLQEIHPSEKSVPAANQLTSKPLETLVLSKKAEDLKGKEKPFYKSLAAAAHESVSAVIKDLKYHML